MVKKIIVLILSLCIASSFAGCGGKYSITSGTSGEMTDSTKQFTSGTVDNNDQHTTNDYDSATGVRVGDIISYGAYAPYDGIEGTEYKPISWIVLAVESDRMLLLSEQVLAGCVMDNGASDELNVSVNWENCSMRSWHLRDFCEQAFSESEYQNILTMSVKNSDDPADNTEDDLFLLSVEEIEKYLPNDEDRIAAATESATIRGFLDTDNSNNAYWWTRSADAEGRFVYVKPNGQIDMKGSWGTYSFYGIRPAMWVKVN